MRVLISTAMADVPALAGVIERFSAAGKLVWLAHKDHVAPGGAPAVSGLAQISKPDQLLLVIAPNESFSGQSTGGHKVLQVVERTSPTAPNVQAVRLDSFAQLGKLLELDKYPGFSQYLDHFNWSPEDFRRDILNRYGNALGFLQNERRAAIFGAQRLGETVLEGLRAQGVTVEAFIDNNPQKHGGSLAGVPICGLSQIADKKLPVVIATTKYGYSITNQLAGEQFVHILPYPVMSLLDSKRFPDEIPYLGIQEDLGNNMAEYISLFLSLADDRSRSVLDGLLGYRQSYEAKFAQGVSDEYSRQYFDTELIKFSRDDVFVDLGGYDGDTVEKYIQFNNGEYSKVYVFEPDSNLIEAATRRLKGKKAIEFIPAGAYSSDGELRFSASGRTNGAFSSEGDLIVPVRKVDSVIKDKPTLIKMDIEGAETEALKGAAQSIRNQHPKLAIAAYHYAPDLWKLADVVRGISPGYAFYLRHYSETGLESVIYAL